MPKQPSRWTDNPFRQPDITPEQLDWIKQRNEAMRIYDETGDTTMAEEIGLFPKPKPDAPTYKELHDVQC